MTYTSSSASSSGPVLTLDSLYRTMQWVESLQAQACDELAQAMRERGFDPAKGGLLILPQRYRELVGEAPLPAYIRISSWAIEAVLINDPLYDLLGDLKP